MRQSTLERVREAVAEFHPTKAQHEDIAAVCDAAIDLQEAMYSCDGHDIGPLLFALRKAIEGAFGQGAAGGAHLPEDCTGPDDA